MEKGFEFVSYFAFIMSKGVMESFPLGLGSPCLREDEVQLQNQLFPWVLYEHQEKIYLMAKVPGFRVTERGDEFSQDLKIFDGMYVEVMEKQGRKSYELLLLHVNSIQFSHQYFYMEDEILIGSDKSCHIRGTIPQTLLPQHARIHKQGNRVMISSMAPQADVYVNGCRYESCRLDKGDMIWCMGLSVVYFGQYIAVSTYGKSQLDHFQPNVIEDLGRIEEQAFEQVPRIIPMLERGTVEILPPTPKEQVKYPLYLTMGPSFAMSLGMLVSVGFAIGNVMVMGPLDELIASGSASLSLFLGAMLWPSLMNNNQKKENIKLDEKRQDKYSLYAETKTKELEERYSRNRKVWNEMLAPSPESLVKMTSKHQTSSNLWERTASDPDFLELRIGLGSHDFEVDIKIPDEIFHPETDELARYPELILNRFKTLKDVPEVISIPKEKCVGICGQFDMVWAMANALMVETMALHHPEDVKTAFFFGDHEKEHFLWAKDLPSVWSDDQQFRFMASNRREARGILQYIIGRMNDSLTQETYLFFVTDRSMLPEVEILGSGHRIYYIFIGDSLADLPKECRAVIRCLNHSAGLYAQGNGENRYIKFQQDELDHNLLMDFRKALLAVPYTPPTHGRSVLEGQPDDTVYLIDFAGQKTLHIHPDSVDEEENEGMLQLTVDATSMEQTLIVGDSWSETVEATQKLVYHDELEEVIPETKLAGNPQSATEETTVEEPESNPFSKKINKEETTESDFSEEKTVESEFTEEKTVEPEFTKEKTVEPEFTEEKTVEPEFTEEKTVEPEFTEEKTVEPEFTEEKTVEPAFMEEKTVETEFTEEKTVEPEFTEEKTVEPEFTEEKTVEPEFTEEEAIEDELEESLFEEVEPEESAFIEEELEEFSEEYLEEEPVKIWNPRKKTVNLLDTPSIEDFYPPEVPSLFSQLEDYDEDEFGEFGEFDLEEEEESPIPTWKTRISPPELEETESEIWKEPKLEERNQSYTVSPEHTQYEEDAPKFSYNIPYEEDTKYFDATVDEELDTGLKENLSKIEDVTSDSEYPEAEGQATALEDELFLLEEDIFEGDTIYEEHYLESESGLDDAPLFEEVPLSEDDDIEEEDTFFEEVIFSDNIEPYQRKFPEFQLQETLDYESRQDGAPIRTRESSMKKLRSALLTSLYESEELERLDLSSILFEQGLFVSGTHGEVVNNLILTMGKFAKVDYVFSSNKDGGCNCFNEKLVWGEEPIDRAIEQIREYMWSFHQEKCVILIPSYHEFCLEVSKRGLDRLTRVLKKHRSKVALIIGETVDFLEDYGNSDFFHATIRQEQGIVTNPSALEELLPYLAENLESPTTEIKSTDFLYYYQNKWSIFFM